MEKKIRASARARITKVINLTREVLDNDNHTATELKVCLAKLVSAEEKLNLANEAFNKTLNEETIMEEFDAIDEYDNKIIEQKVELSEKIERLNLNDSMQSSFLNKRSIVKIPKITMEKFNGELSHWMTFWEQFKTLIHENGELDDVAKFNYLKSLLTGKAYDVVNGLVPSADSYNQAIEILISEYASVDRIVESYVNKLSKMQVIKDRNDKRMLRELLNTTTTTVRSLESLRISKNEYTLVVFSNVMRCFPISLKVEFYRTTSVEGDEDKIKRIIEFLKAHVLALERVSIENNEERQRSFNHRPFKSERSNVCLSTSGCLPIIKCYFCGSSDHKAFVCTQKTSLSEKKAILARQKRCFRCFGLGHLSKLCKTKNVKCFKCNGRHYTIMCDPNYANQSKLKRTSETESNNEVTLFSNNSNRNVFLQTAKVLVKNNNTTTCLRVIIDGGSQSTFIKEEISNRLKLPIVGTQSIKLSVFGSNQAKFKTYNKVRVRLWSQFGNGSIEIEAIVVPEICMNSLMSPTDIDLKLFNLELADKNNENYEFDEIGLLLGADYYWLIVNGKTIELDNGLRAVGTIFGWTVHGLSKSGDSLSANIVTSLCVNCSDEDADMSITKMWDLDMLGISPDLNNTLIKDKEFVNDFMKNNIVYRDKRYEVKLPWKNENASLENNLHLAKSSLKRLVFNLSKNETDLSDYHNAIKMYLNNDWAEKITNDIGKIYYMPHRPVYRFDKETTKLRVVFNASSRLCGNDSLNDLLEPGPVLNLDLYNSLMNFRFGKYAMMGDIEKAFTQILISEADRDSHRFLWYDSLEDIKSNCVKEYRMKRLTFGITSSPFCLAAVLNRIFNDNLNVDPVVIELIRDKFYVDDFCVSADTIELMKRIYNVVVTIFERASMNVRKWKSNSEVLDAAFKDSSTVNVHKVFGIGWNVQTDQVGVDMDGAISYLNDMEKVTKRGILQFLSRIYDPLGFLTPFLVKLKLLVQALWKEKIDWDDPVSENFQIEWDRCVKSVELLRSLTINRFTGSINQDDLDIHIFCDASLKAYGLVVYVRYYDERLGRVVMNLLCSKARLAPLSKGRNSVPLTIPKLELTACLMGARMYSYLRSKLKISVRKYYLWTDSLIALGWIKMKSNEIKSREVYVKNRRNEIRELTGLDLWSHCDGKSNPADIVSRGLTADEMSSHMDWYRRPVNIEIKSEIMINETKEILLSTSTDIHVPEIDYLVLTHKFERWSKLLRVMSYVFRFVNNCRKILDNYSFITSDEIRKAELFICKTVQVKYYAKELRDIQNNKSISNKSTILSLNPFIDKEGLLRVGGRLKFFEGTESDRNPIILPKEALESKKIVEHAHILTKHGGVNTVITKVRSKFWIVRIRQLAKGLISKCSICRRIFAKPLMEKTAPLPLDRMKQIRPFDVTGIDFCGPFYVFEGKIYIVIFTCASVRAIHLEITATMNSEDFMRALRRFISRRGVPSIIYSDNAKTFKRSKLEIDYMNNVTKNEKFVEYLQTNQINWKNIVERAPWWGGFWERLIRSVKNALKLSVGKKILKLDEFQTVLAEIEAIVNSRPLTYVGESLNILTPNSFLTNASITLPMLSKYKEDNITSDGLRMLWRKRQRVFQMLWYRWRNEYLKQLRSLHHSKLKKSERVVVDGIYMIKDDCQPRLNWKLGRVVKVHIGKDGVTRSCTLKLASGIQINRAIQNLYPIEIPSDDSCREDVENLEPTATSQHQ